MSAVEIPSQLLGALSAAKRVVVLTGAGISAESGVPTFRDAQTGFWAKYRPEELATRDAFQRNPKLVWDWYASRREALAGARPNPGHDALVALERRVSDFTLATQNVDGLHHAAGSRNVVELHGNIRRVRCFDDDAVVESWDASGEVPPRCPRCGGFLRPDVVWFGEALPAAALERAIAASRAAEVFLCVGTSSLVHPAASLPLLAGENGAVVVEVNLAPTPLTPHASFALHGPSGSVLPALLAALP